MKYLKILGLAAVAAMALMAFASSASATRLYKEAGTHLPIGTEIHATLKTGTSAKLTDTEGHVLDTCTSSTIFGKTTTTGSATETVKGLVEAKNLIWGTATTPCSVGTTTTEGGELEIHSIAGTTNGTLTAKNFKVSINTVLFGTCVFTAGEGTHMGELKGNTTGNATMVVNAIVKKISGICNSTGNWVAEYTVTTPTKLWVEES
jgi:hypothetical protein